MGRVYLTGDRVVRDAAESRVEVARFYRCPWGLVDRVGPALAMHTAVAPGHSTVSEYVEGRPSAWALNAMAILDVELPMARKAAKADS